VHVWQSFPSFHFICGSQALGGPSHTGAAFQRAAARGTRVPGGGGSIP
jgi:hypothetical protein